MADDPSVIEGLSVPEVSKKYIQDVFDPILMDLVQGVLTELPDLPVEFVIEWLRSRGGITEQTSLMSLKEKNASLRKNLTNAQGSAGEFVGALQEQVGGKRAGSKGSKGSAKSDSEEEESEDDAEAQEAAAALALRLQAASKGPRQSVSAEAYGDFNIKRQFTAPVYKKTDDQKVRLRKTLMRSFLFNALSDKDLEVIVNAMEEKTFSAGQRIITEGEDDGNDLYVIEEGSPECKKLIDGEQKVVKTCGPGDVFGELALLYNCPRAATVETQESCLCWRLDRETFNSVVREAATKRTAQYDTFLQEVVLFQGMDKTERSLIIDALKCDSLAQGDAVITQGDPGDRVYIVEEGTLAAMKKTSADEEPRNVNDYTVGMYFGELALLRNQPRAASVVVTSATAKVVSIDRKCFMNLVGTVSEILNRQAATYN